MSDVTKEKNQNHEQNEPLKADLETGAKPKRSKKKLIVIIVVAALVVLAAFRIASSGTKAVVPTEETAINVSTVTVQEGTLDSYVTISGSITPKSQVYVTPKVSGKVTAVYVELGQWVNKGDRLFSIDKTDVAAQLESARAAVSSAQAVYDRTVGGSSEQAVAQLEVALETSRLSYEQAKSAFDRTQTLYDAGGVSQQAYEQAKSACDLAYQQYLLAQTNYDLTVNKILGENEKSARAALDQAQATYQTAQNAYNNTELTAEVSGYIGTSSVVVGGMVSSASPPMSIVDISEVYAEVGLPETVINKALGQQAVSVVVSSIKDKTFEGTIVGISPSTSASTQTYQAKIAIDNSSGELKGGMFASVKFKVDSVDGAIYVPVSAVSDSGGETYVYVVDSDMRAQKRIVTEGMSNNENVEIVSGLDAGDVVVTKGQDFLEDGTLVEIVKTDEAS